MYTSLTIIRKTTTIWSFIDSSMGEGAQPRFANCYSGIGDSENNLTFTTKTGAIIYQSIPASIISYVDELDPTNNFDASSSNTALSVGTFLEGEGFFGISSGGGGVVTAFTDLSDTPNFYFGYGGKVVRVRTDETGLEFFDPGTFLQNNIGKRFIIPAPPGGAAVTLPYVVGKINTAAAPYVISETDTPVKFTVAKGVAGGAELYIYEFQKGKGAWGGIDNVAGQVNTSMFFSYPVVPVTIPDIEDDPATQVVNFTLEPGQTISQWLNTQDPAIAIQSQDAGYTLFKSGATTYLWTGDIAGNYGDGELQSTDADFQLLDSEAPAPGTPNLNQVTLQGNQSNQPIVVRNNDADSYIENNGLQTIFKGANGKAVKAGTRPVAADVITNFLFEYQYNNRWVAIRINETATTITLPELIGADDILQIVGRNLTITDFAGFPDFNFDALTGTISGFPFTAGYTYNINFKTQ